MLGATLRAAAPAARNASRQASPASSLNFWKQVWMGQQAAAPRTTTRAWSSATRTLAQRPATRPTTAQWNNMSTLPRMTRRTFRFSSRWGSSQAKAGAEESLTLSQRLKKLSKEYGWSAVGVYFALSVLDFPFCFLLVRVVGTDRIARLEHWVVSHVSQFIPESVKDKWADLRVSFKKSDPEDIPGFDVAQKGTDAAGWGVEAAQLRNDTEASLGTQLALAYAIHKSFIFLRVPLTAAVTPKVVKVLRSWGWKIGKRKTK
ncbi:hypothetical protein B0T11DRAFT_284626 [Plectosphaerella cucumerina]|uniref:DUF1279 domain-containing protein n=1 Tax=Plectosphaerella cucumerina TaxID=40658 RepID=A0A8K0TFD3_9PEZI|nr:hypothetical protein B0T11DRAFT_284626 [Plectosphaerella cucumerina]